MEMLQLNEDEVRVASLKPRARVKVSSRAVVRGARPMARKTRLAGICTTTVHMQSS